MISLLLILHYLELSQLDEDEQWKAGSKDDGGLDEATHGLSQDRDLDEEYGGRLDDENCPFQGTGVSCP